ncbi:unnamed protein product [Pleuronectes platessa]|uniref:Uncharacterized protein n=1 Tax=Pleuronectes platessa TaxID=8262 RepID=A0A9N7Y844_PLEPL|nr:unnamed protein product [Pleuronectes platessa]
MKPHPILLSALESGRGSNINSIDTRRTCFLDVLVKLESVSECQDSTEPAERLLIETPAGSSQNLQASYPDEDLCVVELCSPAVCQRVFFVSLTSSSPTPRVPATGLSHPR